MDPYIISSLATIAFAGLIHSSFQLSVSVLTLLSGHSLGRKTAHKRVLRLTNSFIIGVVSITTLLLTSLAYYFEIVISQVYGGERLLAAIASGLLAGLGLATWGFYYRRGSAGTALWLPRNFAHYLTKRTKATKSNAESLGLGMVSVIAELLFIIAPMMTAALVISSLDGPLLQITGIIIYTILSILPLIIILILVGSGHRISRIQAWREENRPFLQFIGGGSLIILSAFIIVERLIGYSLYGGL